jgi:hypothetical protein
VLPIRGDINGDRRVNVQDATLALKAIASLITLTEGQLQVADYDGNAKLNIQDAIAILLKAAGILP